MQLDPIQLRVLGALIEKEITTPENYPLSLNALLNACNQRSSRDPVLDLDEEAVRQALHTLEDLGLTAPNRDSHGNSASRVPKYEHRIRTVLNLRRDETALLCLLLLRGPQTPGELRSRADRMYSFDDLAAVVSTLERLAARPAPSASPASGSTASEKDPSATGPLTTILPRQPGSREARYAHLLGGPIELRSGDSHAAPTHTSRYSSSAESASPASSSSTHDRLAHLEAEVVSLQSRIQSLMIRIDQIEAGQIETVQPRAGQLEAEADQLGAAQLRADQSRAGQLEAGQLEAVESPALQTPVSKPPVSL